MFSGHEVAFIRMHEIYKHFYSHINEIEQNISITIKKIIINNNNNTEFSRKFCQFFYFNSIFETEQSQENGTDRLSTHTLSSFCIQGAVHLYCNVTSTIDFSIFVPMLR